MPLTKVQDGSNMYQGWVTHTHTHLRGECPHRCGYCYVKSGPGYRTGHYKGPLRLEKKELAVNYGTGKTIFIEHCSDLFAADVPESWIRLILQHCFEWKENRFVFQTKNPERLFDVFADNRFFRPGNFIVGVTIESNRWHQVMGDAPAPRNRISHFKRIRSYWPTMPTFITIEPVLDFNPVELADWIEAARPTFVNIGADSKGHGLVEPDEHDVLRLIRLLQCAGIEIRQKKNLGRLIKNEVEP
ncbi:MAG: DUF5131 family protein [Verrucomicrobia bacterium]|nr:DUF5131 family protein [Verrucomicrobiota bacterium]